MILLRNALSNALNLIFSSILTITSSIFAVPFSKNLIIASIISSLISYTGASLSPIQGKQTPTIALCFTLHFLHDTLCQHIAHSPHQELPIPLHPPLRDPDHNNGHPLIVYFPSFFYIRHWWIIQQPLSHTPYIIGLRYFSRIDKHFRWPYWRPPGRDYWTGGLGWSLLEGLYYIAGAAESNAQLSLVRCWRGSGVMERHPKRLGGWVWSQG